MELFSRGNIADGVVPLFAVVGFGLLDAPVADADVTNAGYMANAPAIASAATIVVIMTAFGFVFM